MKNNKNEEARKAALKDILEDSTTDFENTIVEPTEEEILIIEKLINNSI